MYQPLAGYKVIDCSRLLPGNYCTLLLADLGAEVLKIEEPGRGDYGRWADLSTPGKENLTFLMVNRNKKSMTLNLQNDVGKGVFKKLVAKYDVLFETFRPGVMNKLGLGYRAIRSINPRIIYCSGTGYGQTGPYRGKAGHDITCLSIAGILAVTGEHTGRPVIPGVPFADMAGGGLFPALAIIAAMLGREKTDKGQYIDVAMADVMTSFNIINVARALAEKGGEAPRPYNFRGKNLFYNTYKTKDGKFIAIGNLEPKFWINFCRAIGREDLVEKHYSEYHDGEQTTESLKAIFLSKTQSEWLEFIEGVDNCFAPIHTPDETLEDPHLLGRGVITKIEDTQRGETVQIGFPALFSDGLHYKRSPAPFLGEHTVETLEELGYTSDQISSMKQDGVI